VAALFHDAWHIATHVDDRFWQTMYILLLKPGRLTKEYFAERRARYLPPVRVYLVLSVLFFAFGAISPHRAGDQLKALRAPPPIPSASAPATDVPAPTVPNAASDRHAPGISINLDDDDDDEDTKGTAKHAASGSGWRTFWSRVECDKVESGFQWLQKAVQQSCLRNKDTNGQAILASFLGNIPKMMFVFVPMMALAMLILYWWPRRYYVEHLVFFLHNHAAIFLILLLETFLAWIAALYGWRSFGRWVIVFTSLYTIWYVYRAMRFYYGQGRWLTLTKLFVVGMAYLIGFATTLLFTFIISAILA
jgi:hypothetical protein